MPVEIVMPKLSDTMEEGRILKWLKKEGDFVTKGDVVAEVETDKADMDLEVFSSGVISEIRYAEGETVDVGTVIAVLGGEAKKAAPEKAAPEKAAPKKEEEAPQEATEIEKKAPEEAPVQEDQGVSEEGEPCCTVSFDEEEEAEAAPVEQEKKSPPKKAEGAKPSPAARRLIEAENIDPTELVGSGPGGRIVKEDVENFLKERRDQRQAEEPERKPAASSSASAEGEQVIELSKMRATIAKRMAHSKQTIPHFYVTMDVDMGESDRLLASINKMEGDDGKATYNDIVVKACALALRDYPELNAHVTDQGLIQKRDINVGVVVALKVGLLVPVVHGADRKTVKEISSMIKGLRDRVLKRQSTPEDLSGGTFTVSNMGMFGVDEFSAIINPPQVAILAVAAVKDIPVMRGSTVHPAKIMKMTLSADHRAVDGLIVARFLTRVKELLENPVALILTAS